MRCPKDYLQKKLEEATKRRYENEKKRFTNFAIIEGWRIEVLEAATKFIFAGMCMTHDSFAAVEAMLADDYNFTYEAGRKKAIAFILERVIIPARSGICA